MSNKVFNTRLRRPLPSWNWWTRFDAGSHLRSASRSSICRPLSWSATASSSNPSGLTGVSCPSASISSGTDAKAPPSAAF